MPEFNEDDHPRARKGRREGGQFIDVIGRMNEIGGKWNDDSQTWTVPKDKVGELEDLLDVLGTTVVPVPKGMRIASEDDRKALKIPPAWTQVVVADDQKNAKLLAMGRDQKGRVQRVYSAAHSEAQAAQKFGRIKKMSEIVPQVDAALAEQVGTDDTAAAMLLVRRMGLRPGSDKDTGAEKKAFGASNLQARHVTVNGNKVRLRFTGKKGVDIDLETEDADLARMFRQRLAQKQGSDRLFDTDERKMREWLKEWAPGYKVKDFRTYLATSEAAAAIAEMDPPANANDYKRLRNQIGDLISGMLGNTRTMALGSYIDPSVFGPWEARTQ